MINNLTLTACFFFSFLLLIQKSHGQEAASLQKVHAEFDKNKELDAIMKVINQETKCFFDGDYDCWASSWSQADYAIQAWNTSDGTSDAAVGWEKISAQGRKWIEEYYKSGKNKHHPDFKRQEPQVKFFNENTAYLLWEQYNANPDKTYWNVSQESRIMEKHNDKWKIVNVSSFWRTKPDIPIDNLSLPVEEKILRKNWSEEDRAFLFNEMQRTKDEMITKTENLTHDQWHFKPSEDSWSIAQVVEHIGLYERIVMQEARVANNLPPQPELYEETKSDGDYLKWMAEVNPHVAPENAIPLGFMEGKDNLNFFIYGRDLILNYIKETDRDLKAHFTPRSTEKNNMRSIHGLFVVHFGHTDRHLRQIERIKSDVNYPRN